jgi:hypothetical protein
MDSKTPREKMKFLNSYPWSTLRGYMDGKNKVAEVDYKLILEEFGGDNPKGRQAYLKRIREDVREELERPVEILGQSILGTEGFIDWVKASFLAKGPDREISGARQIKGHKARQNIFKALNQETGKTEAELRAEKGDLRRMAMELLYRVGGLNGVEIGKLFKISYNAVSQERKRLMERMKGNPQLKKKYRSLLLKLE